MHQHQPQGTPALPHLDTAKPLPGRPSRGSTTTRQHRWKSTRPPASSMRARSRGRWGLWSSVRRSALPSRHCSTEGGMSVISNRGDMKQHDNTITNGPVQEVHAESATPSYNALEFFIYLPKLLGCHLHVPRTVPAEQVARASGHNPLRPQPSSQGATCL